MMWIKEYYRFTVHVVLFCFFEQRIITNLLYHIMLFSYNSEHFIRTNELWIYYNVGNENHANVIISIGK